MENFAQAIAPLIERIDLHRYRLPKGGVNGGREGALVRVLFSDVGLGHADLMPWPELGDPPLEKWTEELRTCDFTSQVVRLALTAAYDEARAMKEGRPLIEGTVRNHCLAAGVNLAPGDWLEARRQDYTAMKVKIARNGDASLLEEAEALGRGATYIGDPEAGGVRLRLDANERATPEGLSRFLEALPIVMREQIEFIEDPFSYDAKAWREFSEKEDLQLAIDRPLSRGVNWREGFDAKAFSVFVHKPAWLEEREALAAREAGLRLVVTSILGHTIGGIWAASRAAVLAPDDIHGCGASRLFAKTFAGFGIDPKWSLRLKWVSL